MNVSRPTLPGWALLVLAMAVSSHAASAVGTFRKAAEKPAARDAKSAAHEYFTDVVLLNQNGKPMRLYTDLIQGKVVAINPFFTTCTGACPPMNRNMLAIQERLGNRLGKDVHLISITVDPENDTPPRLEEYAAEYDARPGWHFLTGKKENAELALHKLGLHVEQKEFHKSFILMGNDRTGLWKKAFGLAQSEELIEIFESVLNDEPQE